jgi:hypothetical protein
MMLLTSFLGYAEQRRLLMDADDYDENRNGSQ